MICCGSSPLPPLLEGLDDTLCRAWILLISFSSGCWVAERLVLYVGCCQRQDLDLHWWYQFWRRKWFGQWQWRLIETHHWITPHGVFLLLDRVPPSGDWEPVKMELPPMARRGSTLARSVENSGFTHQHGTSEAVCTAVDLAAPVCPRRSVKFIPGCHAQTIKRNTAEPRRCGRRRCRTVRVNRALRRVAPASPSLLTFVMLY